MRLTFIITLIFISVSCFAQSTQVPGYELKKTDTKTTKLQSDTTSKIDSMDVKVISMKEFNFYLQRIDRVVQDQFSISDMNKYQLVLKEIQAIYAEVDRKRKIKK